MVNLLLFQTVSSCLLLTTLSLKVGFRVLMTPTNQHNDKLHFLLVSFPLPPSTSPDSAGTVTVTVSSDPGSNSYYYY
jgi:hypothetical protein